MARATAELIHSGVDYFGYGLKKKEEKIRSNGAHPIN